MDRALCRIFLVPYPVTPAAVLAFFLFRKLGMLSENTYIRYHYHREGSRDSVPLIHFFGEGAVCRIAHLHETKENRLKDYLSSAIQTRASSEEKEFLLKMLSFFFPSGASQEHRHRLGQMMVKLIRLVLHRKSAREVMEATSEYLAQYEETHTNPWKNWIRWDSPDVIEIPDDPSQPKDYPPGGFQLTIAIEKREGEEMVTALTPQTLLAEHLFELQGRKLFGVIGGPPGAGKSTLAASLISEIREGILPTLRLFKGAWESFSFNAELITMDEATPAVGPILAGQGKIRSIVNAGKREWNPYMAWEAVGKAQRVFSEKVDFALGDLPGKITSEITEVVAAPGDFCILVSRNLDDLAPWRALMERLGIPIVAEMHNTERPSIVTKYVRGEFLGGTIQGLDRSIRSDPTVALLAKLLLLEFVPVFVRNRIIKLHGEHLLRQVLS